MVVTRLPPSEKGPLIAGFANPAETQARRVGGHSRSCYAGATPRVGRRAHEKGSLPGDRLP
jgi:hypothetical protein